MCRQSAASLAGAFGTGQLGPVQPGWDHARLGLVGRLHVRLVLSLRFSPSSIRSEGAHVCLAPPRLSPDKSRIWDTSTGQCLKTLVNEDNAPVASIRFTPNSNFLFTSTLDSAIRLWDYQTDKVVKAYTGHTNRK